MDDFGTIDQADLIRFYQEKRFRKAMELKEPKRWRYWRGIVLLIVGAVLVMILSSYIS